MCVHDYFVSHCCWQIELEQKVNLVKTYAEERKIALAMLVEIYNFQAVTERQSTYCYPSLFIAIIISG